jgi:hypothetical protein
MWRKMNRLCAESAKDWEEETGEKSREQAGLKALLGMTNI